MRGVGGLLFTVIAVCGCFDASGIATDESLTDVIRVDASRPDVASDTAVIDTALVDSGAEALPTLAEVCEASMNAFCVKYFACAPFTGTVAWGDVETCRAHMKPACIRGLDTPGVGYTGSEYRTCMLSLPSTSCESFFLGTMCTLPAGTLKNGSPCGTHVQCASRFCQLTTSTCGTCAPAPAEGTPCTNNCPTGMHCAGTPKTCRRYGTLGAVCAADRPCGPPLVCSMSRCVEPAKPGEACDPTGTVGKPCNAYNGYYCGPSSTCIAFATARAGEPCGIPHPYRYCVAGSTCSATGTCVAPVVDGAACNPATYANCVSPSSCVAGTCKAYEPAACN